MKNYILIALAGSIIFSGCANNTPTSTSNSSKNPDESSITVEINKDAINDDIETLSNQTEKQVDEVAASIQMNYEEMMHNINQEIDVLQRQARTATDDVSSDLKTRIDFFERKKEAIKKEYKTMTLKTPDSISVKVDHKGWNNVKSDMDALWSDIKKEVDNGVSVTIKAEEKK